MERTKNLLQKLDSKLLCCPYCYGQVVLASESFLCNTTGHGPFAIDAENRPFFLSQDTASYYEEKHQSGINRLKSLLKRYPALYYFIWNIFCPVWVSRRGLKKFKSLLPPNAKVLNLGSGPKRMEASWINMDVVPFEHVDVVADALHLPFQSESLDGVFNESLLEHVLNPQSTAEEIRRVLKPGGLVYTSTPFLTPYHASPDDFNRWTLSGLEQLFSGFETVDKGVDAGPWSALLVFLAYWLGVVFSFGNKKLGTTLAFIFMLILGPLKVLDFIFVRLPGAEAVAAQIYLIARKR